MEADPGLTRATFDSRCRLSDRKQFASVVTSGKKTVERDLLLWIKPRMDHSEGASRLGISVSRKMGKAVRRNRLRRLIREAFRLNRHRLVPGYDLVAYPRLGCRWNGLSDAEGSFISACRKAGLLQSVR